MNQLETEDSTSTNNRNEILEITAKFYASKVERQQSHIKRKMLNAESETIPEIDTEKADLLQK